MADCFECTRRLRFRYFRDCAGCTAELEEDYESLLAQYREAVEACQECARNRHRCWLFDEDGGCCRCDTLTHDALVESKILRRMAKKWFDLRTEWIPLHLQLMSISFESLEMADTPTASPRSESEWLGVGWDWTL